MKYKPHSRLDDTYPQHNTVVDNYPVPPSTQRDAKFDEEMVGLLTDSDIRPIKGGLQFRLRCGVIISTYGDEGVVVQGKLVSPLREKILSALRTFLPPETHWDVR